MHREEIKSKVVARLKKAVGRGNAIKGEVLYVQVTDDAIIPAKRNSQTRIIRSIVRELREKRELPVMSSSNGYWLAESDQELREYVEQRLIEAKRMIKLGSQLSGVPVDRMVEQLKIKLKLKEQINE